MTLPETKLEVAALSETGYVRSENQDRMSGSVLPLGHLYIVADGMGGHKGGALAAEITVKGLQQNIGQAPAGALVEEVIRSAFEKVNREIYLKAHSGQSEIEGMGSTAVLLLVSGQIARVAHVGDSRAYVYCRQRLTQVTTDHTLVQKMVDRGMLSAQETFNHPNANILERAIGNDSGVKVDITDELKLDDGDAVLLCSDGLTGYVRDDDILRVLRSPETVQGIPKRLVNLALQAGGKDNVTVQFIQYGTRKEAPANPRGGREGKFWKRLFSMAMIFLVGAALSAGGTFLYMEKKLAEIRSVLQEAKTAADSNGADAEVLREQLQVAATQKDTAETQAEHYKQQLKKNQNKLSESQSSLQKAQKAADRSIADLKELRKQLEAVKAERDTARSDAAGCEQKLAAMKAQTQKQGEAPDANDTVDPAVHKAPL